MNSDSYVRVFSELKFMGINEYFLPYSLQLQTDDIAVAYYLATHHILPTEVCPTDKNIMSLKIWMLVPVQYTN